MPASPACVSPTPPHYGHALAENLAALVVKIAADYSHVLAPATTTAKNVMPRVAALLDVAQISEIVAVESADTFVRPIYAGNVLATVRSADPHQGRSPFARRPLRRRPLKGAPPRSKRWSRPPRCQARAS